MVAFSKQRAVPRALWWLLQKTKAMASTRRKNWDYQFYAAAMFVEGYLLK